MSEYTIGGKLVKDLDAIEGLKAIQKSDKLKKFHNGDNNFTEKELGDSLDIYDPQENKIDGGDISTHTILENTGLTERQFTVLAREYRARFPQGSKSVSITLLGSDLPPKEDKAASTSSSKTLASLTVGSKINTDPKVQFLNLIRKAQYTFIGEAHLVTDESIFIPMVADIYKQGVRNLALEIGSDQKDAMDHFLKTGETSLFTNPFDKVMEFEPGWKALIQAAHKAGIKIVCVDMPFQEQVGKRNAQREAYITTQLLQLKDTGKTVVLSGSAHSAIDKVPYASARTQIAESGLKTAGVKLESRNGIEVARRFGFGDSVGLFTAFNTYYGDKDPEKPIAFPTTLLGDLTFTDPTPNSGEFTQAKYSQAFDLVVFLPENDSKLLMK